MTAPHVKSPSSHSPVVSPSSNSPVVLAGVACQTSCVGSYNTNQAGISVACVGSASVFGAVSHHGVGGKYAIGYDNKKVITVGLGTRVVSPLSQDTVVLPLSHYTGGSRGVFSIQGTLSTTPTAQVGSYNVFAAGIVSAAVGTYMVGYNQWAMTGLGLANIQNSVTVSDRGAYQMRGALASIRQRGAYKIYTNYAPHRRQGTFNIYGGRSIVDRGVYRVANQALDAYCLFVGVGQLPNFTAAPSATSASLPFNYHSALPGSGTTTLFVTVRKRNVYGLLSQTQQTTTLILTPAGLQRGAVPAPTSLYAAPIATNIIRVGARYPTITTDQYPADVWRVWVGSTAPNPATDTPTYIAAASEAISVDLTGYGPGTWYVVVGLYRTADSAQTVAAQRTVVYPVAPAVPLNAHTGNEYP